MSYKLSLVISAYNRREYLLEAIKSAVNQNVDRSTYEIVVVKNFTDPVIDGYIEANNIVHRLIGDTAVGESIALSLETASGEYVSFLDDDDIISQYKVEKLMGYLTTYDNIAYLHNGVEILSSEKDSKNFIRIKSEVPKIIDFNTPRFSLKRFLNEGGDFNLSSITVNRRLLLERHDLIEKTKTHTDVTVFVSLLDSTQKMMDVTDTLTFYRVHDNGKVSAKNIDANIETYDILMNATKSRNMRSILKSKKSEFVVKRALRDYDFERSLVSGASLRLFLASVFPVRRYRLYIAILGFIFVLSPKFARSLYTG